MSSKTSLRIVASIVACLVCVHASADESTRLDRDNLLQYHAADGTIQSVATHDDWQLRRAEIIRGMEQVMGKLPGDDRRVPLEVTVEEEADAGTYVRRLVTYQSEPDSRTPAYLCIPKAVLNGGAKAPAVLCLHPTDNKVGHKVVVGLGGRAGRQYAAELAERGYVTLSPSYPHLASYWPNLQKLGYQSGTMKAAWDNIRGLDLLASLPVVDSSRGFGAIGHSLGGHNTIYTAVFEPRITVLVSSCGFDSFLDYYGGAEQSWYFGKGWCQIRYMPILSNYRGRLETIPFDFPELLGAVAPRPLLRQRPASRCQLPIGERRPLRRGRSARLRTSGRSGRSHRAAPRLRPQFPGPDAGGSLQGDRWSAAAGPSPINEVSEGRGITPQ